MDYEFGMKELYDVKLKSTYNMEINGVMYVVGEVIAAFDKILMANFSEQRDRTIAKGGYENQELIYWEKTRELDLEFTQGIFSKTQYALMTNSKLIRDNGENYVTISQRETLESDEAGIITLSHEAENPIFVYSNGSKISYTVQDTTHLKIEGTYTTVIVDYLYKYDNGYSLLTLGSDLVSGFLTLEGKTRIKDDITGQVKTGYIYIPKLKLMSDLSMRLGREATPMLGTFRARAVPNGERGNIKVFDIFFLEDDIDSDM